MKGTQLYSVRCLEEHNADFVAPHWAKPPRHAAYAHLQRRQG